MSGTALYGEFSDRNQTLEIFSLAGRGPGECGAGVFDLIEVNLTGAEEALKEGKLNRAATLAVRALLVTSGEQPDSDREAFELF